MMNPELFNTKGIYPWLRRSLQAGKPIRLTMLDRTKLQIFLQAAILFLLFGLSMAVIQFSTPDMPDNDGYYHIKMAQIMRQEGLRPDFPWLPLSILNEREYYDHHFLFHVALIPFTFGDLRLGAKWASVIFASLAFVCVWWLLRGQKVRYAGLWALGLLVVSDAFLYRMSITRAQSLSLGVLALSLHWMLQGRTRLFFLVGFVYVWLYNAFPLLPILAVVYALAVWLVERRLVLKPLLYSVLGIIAGLVINPYFPYDIIFAVRHILPKALEATAVRVGNEWYPYTTAQLVENSWPALLILSLGFLSLGLSGRRMNTATALAMFAMFLFGWMTLESRRFIEYFPPFALIFGSLAFQSLLVPGGWLEETFATVPDKLKRYFLPRQQYWWIGAAAVILVALSILHTLPATMDSMQGAKPYQTYADASAWLMENTEPGERIFQTDWDDFPRLFFYNTHNTYLAGLDPTYLQSYNAQLYDDWVAITRGQVDQPSEQIEGMFASRYAISDLNHTAFIREARADPRMEEVYRDRYAVIFHIIQ
jgi:hypothetical protein